MAKHAKGTLREIDIVYMIGKASSMTREELPVVLSSAPPPAATATDFSWIVRATERIAKLQPGTNDGVIAMIIREEWAMGTQ